jgi:hypothetical protein
VKLRLGSTVRQPTVENVPADCHPKVRAIVDYWLSIHPSQGLPGRQHFDPIDIPNFLPNVRLIEVVGDPPRFKIRLAGSRVSEFFGEEESGRWFDEIYPRFAETPTCESFVSAVQSGEPSWRRGKCDLKKEKDFARLERVHLPFATDGKTIDMLLTFTLYGPESGELL